MPGRSQSTKGSAKMHGSYSEKVKNTTEPVHARARPGQASVGGMFSAEELALIAEVEGFAASAAEGGEVRNAVHPLPIVQPAAVRVKAAAEPPTTRVRGSPQSSKEELRDSQREVVDDSAHAVTARLRRDLALLRKIGDLRAAETARGKRDERKRNRTVHRAGSRNSSAGRDRRGRSGADDVVGAGGGAVSSAKGSQRRVPIAVAARSAVRPASPTTSEESWSYTSSEESYGDERRGGGGARSAARDEHAHAHASPLVSQPTAARGCCHEVALYINDVCCGICDSCLPRPADPLSNADPEEHAYATLPRSGGGERRRFASDDYDSYDDDYAVSLPPSDEGASGGVGRSSTLSPRTLSDDEEEAAAAAMVCFYLPLHFKNEFC